MQFMDIHVSITYGITDNLQVINTCVHTQKFAFDVGVRFCGRNALILKVLSMGVVVWKDIRHGYYCDQRIKGSSYQQKCAHTQNVCVQRCSQRQSLVIWSKSMNS